MVPHRTSHPQSAVSPPQKLPDFTEDPFRNYRYEDVFSIADPFADDDTNANATAPKTEKSDAKFDPFGLELTSGNDKREPFPRDFESDFSKTTFPQAFVKATNDKFSFSPEKTSHNSSNISNNNSSSPKPANKPINFDEAFSSMKRDRTKRSDNISIAQAFKDKLGLGHNNLHKSKTNNNSSSNAWSEDAASMMASNMTEHQQLAWAAQQSLRAEEERKKIKDQEEADLALALKLSREEKSGNKF